MDERFGEWLRDALADVDDDILKRRWSAVESLANDLDESEILDLVLYTTTCPPKSDESIQKARKAFWEYDNAFRMEGNDLELRRLCGAIVIHSLSSTGSPQRMRTALACVCLHIGSSQHDFGWGALREEAEEVLGRLAVGVRSGDAKQGTLLNTTPQNKILARLRKLIDDGHDQVPIHDLHQFLTQFQKDIKHVATDNRSMHTALSIQKEETDILWWLMAGYSNDLTIRFSGLASGCGGHRCGKRTSGPRRTPSRTA